MRQPTRDHDLERFREALEWTVGYPFLGGNDVKVLRNGVEIFPEMLGAIGEAQTTIILNRAVTETFDAHFEQDLEAAEKIVLERWRKRPLRQRLRENVVRRILAHEA